MVWLSSQLSVMAVYKKCGNSCCVNNNDWQRLMTTWWPYKHFKKWLYPQNITGKCLKMYLYLDVVVVFLPSGMFHYILYVQQTKTCCTNRKQVKPCTEAQCLLIQKGTGVTPKTARSACCTVQPIWLLGSQRVFSFCYEIGRFYIKCVDHMCKNVLIYII